MTKRAITKFRVVEGTSNQPWIMLEPLGGDDLDMFRGKTVVGFDLPAGTSFERGTTDL